MGFKDNPIIYLVGKTWKYSEGNRKNVVFYIILFIFANLLYLVDPLIIAKILNIIQEKGVTETTLVPILLLLSLYFIIAMLFWAFHGPARVIERKNGFLVYTNYKKFLLSGVFSLPIAWHTDHHSGNTIDKIEKGTSSLSGFGSETFDVIYALFKLVGSFIALVFFNIHATYIVIIVFILTIVIINKIDKIQIKQYKKLNKYDNEISARVYDSISNITTIIILRVEKLVSKSLFRKIMSPFKLFIQEAKTNELKWFFVTIGSTSMFVLVLGSYIYFNFKSGAPILIGTVYVLYEYVSRIEGTFSDFAWKYGRIIRQKTNVTNSEELSKDFKEFSKKSSAIEKNWKELKIKNLTFGYGSTKKKLQLEKINTTIKRKEKIAIIGESGSGKTTFLKIMRDLYNPQNIELSVDNHILKSGFNSISESIALIPQDPELFSTTIEKNITLGIKSSEDEIKRFTDMAKFSKIVKRLPKGLKSSVVEKGVNLSGGEKQRLALSRGLMASKDKEIILLDEPTSSIDMENEYLIYQNIFKKFKNKTVISTIHRLHLLELFDKVILFKNGKIIASGSFQNLFENSKEFRKLWDKYNTEKYSS
jgi:ATP-binding cassette, subfamily B, bacterial